eukprot:4655740-Lingulodinium_polyedra.AAC.1
MASVPQDRPAASQGLQEASLGLLLVPLQDRLWGPGLPGLGAMPIPHCLAAPHQDPPTLIQLAVQQDEDGGMQGILGLVPHLLVESLTLLGASLWLVCSSCCEALELESGGGRSVVEVPQLQAQVQPGQQPGACQGLPVVVAVNPGHPPGNAALGALVGEGLALPQAVEDLLPPGRVMHQVLLIPLGGNPPSQELEERAARAHLAR